ncbi:dihydrolipoamide acetyltransferase family protein [Conexibacter arvalis]|uniref:Dihydrolipoamide acetyltransferase component of pyruvate dehydrogenase complex n=1 Tax=Conexibacter arvalis TaxID=912552 RepID=A0A840IEH1_9ACTN|nr:dihydrolipoamide acetyltransferase family protein [Conexibacter arvalis]MBB4663206.1 pyruvate dehydrogenase E2 component (dihydrolipoamide acetyltransferase) [Conexibacter arvalis]
MSATEQAAAIVEVPLPRLSDSMEEGTIVTWLAADGEAVTRGQEIVEVETDKATMPYEAEVDGILHIAVQEGETAAVGAIIARIAPEGVAVEAAAPAPAPAPVPAAPAPAPAAPVRENGRRVSASPLARRIARELGIDLAALVGSGPNGRVVKRDVLAAQPAVLASGAPLAPVGSAPAAPANGTPAPAAASAQASPAADAAKGAVERIALSRVQQTIAKRMAEAKQAPEFVLDAEVDMSAAIALRERFKQLLAGGERKPPSLGDFAIKAAALALREHPRANGAFAGDAVELYGRVNVGVAVAAPDALLVPTVFDADVRSLGQIAADVRRLAAAGRAGRLTPQEMSGATFTVSNLGMFGVDAFTAVLNPPQAAILAVGAIRERAVGRDGALVLAPTMVARLTCDHRILNGADGAALLARIRELLETPELLAL